MKQGRTSDEGRWQRRALRAAAWLLLIGPVALPACRSAEPPAEIAVAGRSTTLAVRGRANANVTLAAAGSFVVAVWSASEQQGATDVYAATSVDGGITFGEPSRVNAEPGRARAGGEQPPRVAIGGAADGQPEIRVTWLAPEAAGPVLLSARSTDGGKSFGPSSVLPGTDAPGNRGWHSTAASSDGRMLTAWLDHRDLLTRDAAVARHHHGSGHAATGEGPDTVALAQLSAIHVTSDVEPEVPRRLSGGVCYCCKTSVAIGSDGMMVAAWRHVYPGNMRDIALAVSRDGGRTFAAPVRVSEDLWSIAGCPDDGPAVAIGADSRIHVVWPTVVEERGEPRKALFHAMSEDGMTFTPRVQLPVQDHANHPQLALDRRGRLIVVWDESGSGDRRIATAVGRADGEGLVRFEREAAGASGAGVYPAVAATKDGTVRAWTRGGPTTSVIQVLVTDD